MWQLADLPSYDYNREENRHRVVVLERIKTTKRACDLIATYLQQFRTKPAPEGEPLSPFTLDAIDAIFTRTDGKPRDILKKANALIETGSEENWPEIDKERAARVLDSFTDNDEGTSEPLNAPQVQTRADIWSE